MGNRIDLTNQRFGKLVAEEWVPAYKGSEGRWKCRCDCGNISYVPTYLLRCGNTKSCGCGRIDSARKKKFETRLYQGAYTESHRPRLYWTWLNMIRRCENSKAPDYYRYGALGITVCEEWHDLPTFLNWAYSNGWQEGLTLDRIDNDSEYCPANCRWADRYTQGNNKRTNVFLEMNGERHTVVEWSRIVDMSPNMLYDRVKSGWPVEDILATPPGATPMFKKKGKVRVIEYNGEIHTLLEWSKIVGISAMTLGSRYSQGWSPEDILTKPVQNHTKKVKS